MINMLINANVLALASYTHQQCTSPQTKMSHLCNISIETQGVTDPQDENNNHSPSIRQETQYRYML